MRHRQPKGPVSARPHLNRRATPRLHLLDRRSRFRDILPITAGYDDLPFPHRQCLLHSVRSEPDRISAAMNRTDMWRRIEAHPKPWDMIVVGGGATGVGVAIDAAARGYDVLLLEQSDFGKGTSSRSTKLAHGGVRYLEQGNIGLVMEALKERGLLLQNAPHIVHDLAFVVPNYDWWEAPFYGLGSVSYTHLTLPTNR